MSLSRTVARNLDEPPRIVGLSPLELASCAITYAVLSPLLRGVPLAALLSLVISVGVAATLLIMNRTYPPDQALLFVLSVFRPRVTGVMALYREESDEN